MSSSKILAPRSLLPPFRPTLGTHSPAHHIAESRHVTDMAAVFTVCLCTANSGLSDAGVDRAACIVTNVFRVRPPGNDVSLFFQRDCMPESMYWLKFGG